jgi:hypothetical protein
MACWEYLSDIKGFSLAERVFPRIVLSNFSVEFNTFDSVKKTSLRN